MRTRLAMGFVVMSIIASIVTGIIYLNIFYSTQLQSRTESLLAYANQLSRMYTQSKDQEMIAVYDQLLDARIWVIRKDRLPMISQGGHGPNKGKGCKGHQSCEVKSYNNKWIREIWAGQQIVMKGTTDFYYGETLSVGVPMWQEGMVVGAVLIHAPMRTIYEPLIKTGIYWGIGVICSALLMMILAILYANDFTRPIDKMKQMAKHLAEGDYDVRSELVRTDELGELASSLDILAFRLEEARQEGEKLECMRKDFVANVSHEFRTPLTIIKGNTEALIDDALVHKEEGYQNILKETMIMERLITDLLDLTKLEQGKMALDLEWVYLQQVVQDAVRSSRQVARAKGIRIQVVLEAYEAPVRTDYLRLRQILMILLDNSIKYTPQDGEITIGMTVEEQITLWIEDTGIGIPKEDLPYIWERFYKVDQSRSVGASSGIGLALAKKLILLLGLEVTVRSQVQKGTKVILYIDKSEEKLK